MKILESIVYVTSQLNCWGAEKLLREEANIDESFANSLSKIL